MVVQPMSMTSANMVAQTQPLATSPTGNKFMSLSSTRRLHNSQGPMLGRPAMRPVILCKRNDVGLHACRRGKLRSVQEVCLPPAGGLLSAWH